MAEQSYADVMRHGAALADELAPIGPFAHGTFLNHYDGGDSSLNGLRVLTAAEVEVMAAQPLAPERPTGTGKVYDLHDRQPAPAYPKARVA